MFNIKLKKFNKIIEFFKKLPRSLAKKSFLVFLAFFCLAVFSGLVIFYYYFCSAEAREELIKEDKLLRPDTERQQRVLQEWQERNEKFHRADFKEYSDPFFLPQILE